MLRPATPLSILLFVAFVLLLLSVISTPIVKGIPLATFDGIDFGVFGHCRGSSCSGPQVGYSTGESIADREHTKKELSNYLSSMRASIGYWLEHDVPTIWHR